MWTGISSVTTLALMLQHLYIMLVAYRSARLAEGHALFIDKQQSTLFCSGFPLSRAKSISINQQTAY